MNLKNKIEANTQLFLSEFAGLNHNLLKQKAAADKWCIEEHLEHLIIINQSYFDVFESMLNNTYKPHFFSKIPGLAGWFGKTIYKAMNPDGTKKIKTFPVWEPSEKIVNTNLAERFLISQNKLKEYADKMEPFIANNSILSSPGKRFVVYSTGMAFEIILMHQLRHFEHCREIIKAN